MGRLWMNEFKKVIGKHIEGLVVVRHPESPQSQVFLIFDDESSYELFGSDIQGSGGIDCGGINAVRLSLKGRPGIDILLDTADLTK